MLLALTVWIARPAAVLAVVACTVAAVAVMLAHAWLAFLACAAGTIAAAWLAFALDRRIADERRRRKIVRLEAWSGTEITAPLRWSRWLLVVGFVGSLTFGVLVAVLSDRSSLPYSLILPAAVGAVLVLVLPLGVSAIAHGYFLRLDPLGIHCRRGLFLAWRDVQAMNLETISTRGAINYALVVALLPHTVALLPRASLFDLLSGPRLRRRDNALVIPLAFAAVGPDLLLQAARLIAGRAGVPIAQGWSRFTDPALSEHFARAGAHHG